jgi:hypothetical protein
MYRMEIQFPNSKYMEEMDRCDLYSGESRSLHRNKAKSSFRYRCFETRGTSPSFPTKAFLTLHRPQSSCKQGSIFTTTLVFTFQKLVANISALKIWRRGEMEEPIP